jgi:hypothetical protein
MEYQRSEWEGMKVNIIVRKRARYGSKLIKEMHTDFAEGTLKTLFEKYPPQDGYMYTFYPDDLEEED